MMGERTFGAKLAAGFGLTLALTLLMTATSVLALRYVMTAKDAVIKSARINLFGAESLSKTMESRISDYRAYLLGGNQENLTATNADRASFMTQVEALRTTLEDSVAIKQLEVVVEKEAALNEVLNPVLDRRAGITDLRDVRQLGASGQIKPARIAVQGALDSLIARERTIVESKRDISSDRTTAAMIFIVGISVVLVGGAGAIAWKLSRDLKREVASAVGHIRSSSAELESAAAQQATGGRDQSSAMNEITTTISELLITSRQIADSAQRVSKIAEETAEAARNGDATIDQTRASITAIRTQVDQIVQHMLALGEKSQQIGGVVDLVSELAEQTNILAINATIEASGAGEWGRRFAVVAEEIRKLADRTAGSAKEIRALIDDVRGAVNTTVMATEIGAKAVDAGSRQFDDATNSFRRIAQLVATTSEATREIELSTKQQSTAVEQVNVAASDTARVTRETEASAVQTNQTAAHLSSLSGNLANLVGSGKH
jgi:methyl-accepting chemotaxis protein